MRMWEKFLTKTKLICLMPYALCLVCAIPANAAIYEWEKFSSIDELMAAFPTHWEYLPEERLKIGPSADCPEYLSSGECEIWLSKPHVRETVGNNPRNLRPERLEELVRLAETSDWEINGDTPAARPLIDRYKLLIRASHACCRDGMSYRMKRAGASDTAVYKSVFDDANFNMMGQRCLMISDADLDANARDYRAAEMMADVRNTCLCKSRDWFDSLLAPFAQMYAAAPEFKSQPFAFAYQDGLQRTVTVSINRDVRNVMYLLSACP